MKDSVRQFSEEDEEETGKVRLNIFTALLVPAVFLVMYNPKPINTAAEPKRS